MDLTEISTYLDGELTKWISKLYLVDTGFLWALDPELNYINRSGDLMIGEESIDVLVSELIGSAAFYDGVATDIPKVSDRLMHGSAPAKIIINSAEWSYFQLQREMVARANARGPQRKGLVQSYYEAMAEFISRKEHYTLLYGDPKNNMEGLFNVGNVTEVDFATNIYSLTSTQLYNQFVTWIQLFITTSKVSNSASIRIKVPERLKMRLSEPYDVNSPSITVYEMLTNPSKGYSVAEITSCTESEGQNLTLNVAGFPSNRDRIIFQIVGECLEQNFAARQRSKVYEHNLKFSCLSFSGMSSVYCPRPNRMMYVDAANA